MVIGSSDAHGLRVVEAKHEIVASLLHPTTESSMLLEYVKSKLDLTEDSNDIRITKLVPAGKDIKLLDFISFKLSVPASLAEKLMSPDMWPTGVRVRPFENRPRRSRPIGNFLPNANQDRPPLLMQQE